MNTGKALNLQELYENLYSSTQLTEQNIKDLDLLMQKMIYNSWYGSSIGRGWEPEPPTESQKNKTKIVNKLREFDSNIQKCYRQASKIGNRKNRHDAVGRRNHKSGYVSKKALDKERDGFLKALERVKKDKEKFYDENLEYFI